MLHFYKSFPRYLFDRIIGKAKGLSLVLGICGPTAILNLNKKKRGFGIPRFKSGKMSLHLSWREVFRAASVSAAIVLIFTIALALYRPKRR